MARRDLTALSEDERKQLINLMLEYITDSVLEHHLHINHFGSNLLDGHRQYIMSLENWLTQNGGQQFVPIPKWNPFTTIPAEFNVVKARDNGHQRPSLENLDPKRSLPHDFQKPAICGFKDATELGNGINGWHGGVHIEVGGAMADATISPAAPIFWCFHAFIDDVYEEFLSCTVPKNIRHFETFNTEILKEKSLLPSGVVTPKLFHEWKEWAEENVPELI